VWLRLAAIAFAFGVAIGLTWPLQAGLLWTASMVRWALATWWMEVEGWAEGERLLLLQVGTLAGTIVVTTLLAAVAPWRRRLWPRLALAAALAVPAWHGLPGATVPDYVALSPTVYVSRSRVAWAEQGRLTWGRPVPTGMVAVGEPRHRFNLAVVFLESVGWDSTSLARADLGTTPFLAELAGRSLVATQVHTTMTSTYKAHVAVLCGVEPWFIGDRELQQAAWPFACLPGLLRDKGWDTAYFTSSGRDMLWWDVLVGHLGFRVFEGYEDFEARWGSRWIDRWEDANGWAYEDDILLRPSEDWLASHRDRPFVVGYMASTPHYEYLAPTRYGRHRFSDDDEYNRYLNSVHYEDNFLRNLFDQYESFGLLDKTVFVLVGDHGEAFGEHLPLQHNAQPYEEALRVPLVIVAPERFAGGVRDDRIANHVDIAPTLMDVFGWSLAPGTSQGESLVGQRRRTESYSSCLYVMSCAAVVTERWKYVEHFDERPGELFDLVADPGETVDLARAEPEIAADLRKRVLGWYFLSDPEAGPPEGYF
jgi:arylsulfatase A-like enzyme